MIKLTRAYNSSVIQLYLGQIVACNSLRFLACNLLTGWIHSRKMTVKPNFLSGALVLLLLLVSVSAHAGNAAERGLDKVRIAVVQSLARIIHATRNTPTECKVEE